MTKRQLIDEVRAVNPTAGEAFLAQFDEKALTEYLGHLKAARARTLRIHTWVRKQEPRRRLAS